MCSFDPVNLVYILAFLSVCIVSCLQTFWFEMPKAMGLDIPMKQKRYESKRRVPNGPTKTVLTSSGTLIGEVISLDGRNASVFKGIPYAEHPVGDLRFKRPVKKKSWGRVRNAFQSGAACVQFQQSLSGKIKESENCLFIDIYAPENSPPARYAALVWIHGGALLVGSGAENIDEDSVIRRFVHKGVIFATINYRLGLFGFPLDGPPESVNLGLWDQVAALTWLQENIHAFGGDPSSVTLIGEDVGAVSISLLSLSPITKDLFQSAIMISGSALSNWVIDYSDRRKEWDFRNIVRYLNCTERVTDIFLVEKGFVSPSDDELLAVKPDPLHTCQLVDSPISCDPTKDPEDQWSCFASLTSFYDVKLKTLWKVIGTQLGHPFMIPDGELVPYDIEAAFDNQPRIPIMIGVTNDEHAMDYHPAKLHIPRNVSSIELKGWMKDFLYDHATFSTNKSSIAFDLITDAAYYHYAQLPNPLDQNGFDSRITRNIMKKVANDIDFVAPCQREALAYANKGLPVYLFSFEEAPNSSVYVKHRLNDSVFNFGNPIAQVAIRGKGAFHGLPSTYLFSRGTGRNIRFNFTDHDELFANSFTDYITNFAKFRKPSPVPTNVSFWVPFSHFPQHHMRLKLPPHLETAGFNWNATSFWNQYIPILRSYAPGFARRLKASDNGHSHSLKAAWIALWVLVALILAFLFAILVYLTAKWCLSDETKQGEPGRSSDEPAHTVGKNTNPSIIVQKCDDDGSLGESSTLTDRDDRGASSQRY